MNEHSTATFSRPRPHGADNSDLLLEVQDLQTFFHT
jgi:hypothetical protein